MDMCARHTLDHTVGAYYTPVPGWTLLAENVGTIGWNDADQSSWTNSTDALFKGFMESPKHKEAILGPYSDQVVAQAPCNDGLIYVTHIFINYPK